MGIAEVFNGLPEETKIEALPGFKVETISDRNLLLNDMSDLLRTYVETGLDGLTEALARDGVWVYDNDPKYPNLGVGVHIKYENEKKELTRQARFEVFTPLDDDKAVESVVVTYQNAAEPEQTYTIKSVEDIGPPPPEAVMQDLNYLDIELYKTGAKQ